MTASPVLYDYWRSSACYRVRIALNLLGIRYEAHPIDLLAGSHADDAYRSVNPQGLVPALTINGQTLTQSLAIIEYLHAVTPGSTLLPEASHSKFRVRQLSYVIAMEIHPICNSSVASDVAKITGGDGAAMAGWMQHYIGKGLAALEGLLAQGEAGEFCHVDQPTMADCCLVPQLYNADRWSVDYQRHPHIFRIATAARSLDAFAAAHPDSVGPTSEGCGV